MKKLFILLTLIAFTFCGCNGETSTTSQKEAVKINLPKDNTVNGYRLEEPETDGMPDKISGIDVSPNSNTATVSSSTSSNKASSVDKTTSSDKSSSSTKTTSSNKTTSTPKENEKNISYCGNKNSKKFHKSTCGALKNTKDKNKVYLGSKNEFLKNGYNACKLCKP